MQESLLGFAVLLALIFLGLPMVTADRQHVTVDLLDHALAPATKRAQRRLVDLFSALVFAVLCWRLWERAAKTAEYGDNTAILHIPLAPLVYFMCLMTGLAAAILLLLVLRPPGETAARREQD